jgi:hypothetical protein
MTIDIPSDRSYPDNAVQYDGCGGHGCPMCGGNECARRDA